MILTINIVKFTSTLIASPVHVLGLANPIDHLPTQKEPVSLTLKSKHAEINCFATPGLFKEESQSKLDLILPDCEVDVDLYMRKISLKFSLTDIVITMANLRDPNISMELGKIKCNWGSIFDSAFEAEVETSNGLVRCSIVGPIKRIVL